MTMYQAIILLNDMAVSNKEGIEFDGNNPFPDNLACDCLRLVKMQGGLEAVTEKWRNWRGLAVVQIQMVFKMANVLLANCTVEMD